MDFAKKLWPKCIGGRWNSVHEVVCRMLTVGGSSMVLPVLKLVLQTKAEARSSKDNDVSKAHPVDELNFDQTKEYQKKMGTWRSNTLRVAEDLLWWIVSDCMRIAMSTLVSFSVAWICFTVSFTRPPMFHVWLQGNRMHR